MVACSIRGMRNIILNVSINCIQISQIISIVHISHIHILALMKQNLDWYYLNSHLSYHLPILPHFHNLSSVGRWCENASALKELSLLKLSFTCHALRLLKWNKICFSLFSEWGSCSVPNLSHYIMTHGITTSIIILNYKLPSCISSCLPLTQEPIPTCPLEAIIFWNYHIQNPWITNR